MAIKTKVCIKVSLNVIRKEMRLIRVCGGEKDRMIAPNLSFSGQDLDVRNVHVVIIMATLW